MWPKMLLELLPHFARLMPVADKYLSTRSVSEKAQEAALAAMAGEMRVELGKGTDAQAGLLRQMQEQTAQLGNLALDVTRTRMAVEGVEPRLARLEATITTLEAKSAASRKLLGIVLVALVLALGLLLFLALRPIH